MKNPLLTLVVCLGSLLLSACGHEPAPNDRATLFLTDKDKAKIFMYVAYDNPTEKPYFHETFRFHVTGYEGDVRDNQYVEAVMDPGMYVFRVDEFEWGGNNVDHARLRQQVQAGGLYFFQAHVSSDNITFTQTDNDKGIEDIMVRKKLCLC